MTLQSSKRYMSNNWIYDNRIVYLAQSFIEATFKITNKRVLWKYFLIWSVIASCFGLPTHFMLLHIQPCCQLSNLVGRTRPWPVLIEIESFLSKTCQEHLRIITKVRKSPSWSSYLGDCLPGLPVLRSFFFLTSIILQNNVHGKFLN